MASPDSFTALLPRFRSYDLQKYEKKDELDCAADSPEHACSTTSAWNRGTKVFFCWPGSHGIARRLWRVVNGYNGSIFNNGARGAHNEYDATSEISEV